MEYFRKADHKRDQLWIDNLHRLYQRFINILKSRNLYDEFFDNIKYRHEVGESYYESGFDGGVTDIPTNQNSYTKITYKGRELYSGSATSTDYRGHFHKGSSTDKKFDEVDLYEFLRGVCRYDSWKVDVFIRRCLELLDISKEEFYNISKEEFFKIDMPNEDNSSKFKEVKEEPKEEKNSKKDQIKEFLENIRELLSNHNINEEDMYGSIQVDESVLITTVEDHREIRSEFIPYIKFIDLSKVSCKNLKVSGLDLRNTNIKLNPAQVYKKDLSNTQLSTSVLANIFAGCNFEGCIISDAPDSEINVEHNLMHL